jgi:OmpA-OmpF porin, OOP family
VPRKMFLSGLLLVSPFFSVVATAQDADDPTGPDVVSGPYVGATSSRARFTDESFTSFGVNYDHGSKVLAGWRLHRNFAVEASYFQLGDISSLVGNSTSFSVEPKGYGVSAIGLLPVWRADFFAKAGIISIDWNSRVAPLTTRFSLDSENGTKLAYGAGAQLRFGGVAVRVEYERFAIDLFDSDIELISLGATYTFNLGK